MSVSHTRARAGVAASEPDALSIRDGHLFIEELDAADLVERFGSPIFVFSETQLRTNLRRIRTAFAEGWPDGPVDVLPAFKANPMLATRHILSEEGAGADIYSPEELDGVLQTGVDPELVSVNGGGKPREHLRRCIDAGVRITVEDIHEIDRIQEVAAELGTTAKIRFRVKSIVPNLWRRTDFSQATDIAPKHPEKIRAMKSKFIAEAKKYQVFPMDASVAARIVAPRPNITAGRTEFVYTRPMTGLPQGDSPMLLNASYTITADIEVPAGGAEGMILTSGGRFGGYGFYLLKGKPVFLWNLVDLERLKWEGADALTPGRHTVVFDFRYEGLGAGTLAFNNMSGLGRPGTGTLKVDGKDVATKRMEKTLPMILQWDEAFDVGSDTLTGVNDADYKPPFALTAKLNKLTIKVDRPQLSPEDIKKLQAAMIEKAKRD